MVSSSALIWVEYRSRTSWFGSLRFLGCLSSQKYANGESWVYHDFPVIKAKYSGVYWGPSRLTLKRSNGGMVYARWIVVSAAIVVVQVEIGDDRGGCATIG